MGIRSRHTMRAVFPVGRTRLAALVSSRAPWGVHPERVRGEGLGDLLRLSFCFLMNCLINCPLGRELSVLTTSKSDLFSK